tara:strand:+ start:2724 stop:5210 length:2487 start_codon:yes stop_codon:yes gene_type:complete
MGFIHSNQSKFYYAYDEKVYINESKNKLIVRYKESKKMDKMKISLSLGFKDNEILWKDDSTYVLTLPNESKKLQLKNKFKNQLDIKSFNDIYYIDSGLELAATDEFLVKFKANITQKEIEELHQKHKVKIVKSTKIYQLLKIDVGSNVLEIANAYQESGLTRFSQPNFISDVELHGIPNDTYFANQFSLHNTGQVFADGHSGTADADIDAPEAWDISTGSSNIVIAVLDQGVTSNHPDLPNTRQIRLNGSNFGDGNPNNPSPTGNSNHGNGCAGIIAATQNNNQGVSGIAPNCQVMPIRIFNTNDTGITPQRLADAIVFAVDNGADIISNSWGYSSSNPNLQPVIRDAIIYATTQGRNNLGCVVVFSAGNTANHVLGNNGIVNFPSNVNVAGVLTVGASDRFDQQAVYSPSENVNSTNNQIIDVVAPSHRAYSCQIATETFEAFTIDIPTNAGYNPVNNTDCGILPTINSVLPNTGTNHLSYTGRFGGTSYSCPQVAGVAALILSIDYNLTQQDVFNIITSTSDKVGGYTYNTQGKSNELGNGRLNAHQALLAALPPPKITGEGVICSTGTETYNLANGGASVNWQKSSNLQIISSSNTHITVKPINTSVNEAGFVQAITASGSTQKTIWIGKPKINNPLPGPGPSPPNTFCQTYYRETQNLIIVDTEGVSSPSSNTDWEWVALSNNFYYTTYKNIINFIPHQVGPLVFQVRAKNKCGWSNYAFFQYEVIDCGSGGGGQQFRVFPNPASNVINITYSIENETTGTSINRAVSEQVTQLRLYDFVGNVLIEKKNGSLKMLDVKYMTEGMYYLEITSNEKKEVHRIIIER